MTRVVKVGGRAQRDAQLIPLLAAAWRAASGAFVVVHGGGDEVTALQRAFGANPRFVDGRRVTSVEDLVHVRMALSGSANKHLVAGLVAAGAPAVGLSGEDAALLVARASDSRLGRVGAPEHVNGALLELLLDAGYLPVISPLAADGDVPGAALNVNADDAAAALAGALTAEELVLVSDVPGVVVDGAPAATLDLDEVQRAIESGAASAGMIAKLEAACAALAQGVERVRIGDLAAVLDPARGTTVLTSRSLV